MKEGKSAPWFQSGWSTRPRDRGNVCGEEAGTQNGVAVGRGRGTWAGLHFTETSLWHLGKSAMKQSVQGNSGDMMKAMEEGKAQRC